MTILKIRFLDLLHDVLNYVRLLTQHWNGKFRELETARSNTLSVLNTFSRKSHGYVNPQFGNVLIDGMWDNPNYWLRYSLLRRALGLVAGKEKGLLGRYSRTQVRRCFSALGINDIVDYSAAAKVTKQHMKAALSLLAGVETPNDFLHLNLPGDFPSVFVYDGILKSQRCSTVEISDPALPKLLAEALAHIEAANRILEEGAFDLIVLSHAVDYTYAPLAWAALKRNIPVLVLYGIYGAARFFNLKEVDLYSYPSRPTQQEMDCMSSEVQERLREQGALQLRSRLTGNTNEIAAIYAYQRRQASVSKATLCDLFDWDPAKPIIGVYNSNWFDYPHAAGLNYFYDYLDWIKQTLGVASMHDSVNWLFKAHPCDDWYTSIRGTRLEDLVTSANQPHIRLADKTWNGLDLIHSLDGIVTCHGTIGIEAPAVGTPVLVAYPGWYGHAGFVVNPTNRDDYLATLRTEWWKTLDKEAARQRAELFAGWMFCIPEWQGGYIMHDDSQQEEIYRSLPSFLKNNESMIEMELDQISEWYASGHPHFHIYKMARAKNFQLSNVATGVA